MARHWFRGRFQASALPLVGPWTVLRSERLPEGPGSLARHWFRGRFQAAFWAPGRADFLYPNQGGNVSPDSAANSGRAGLTPPSLELRPRERQSYQGASGGPDSAANRAAGRADTPRWMAVAPHGGPGGSPAALCHFLSAEKVKPGLPVRPEQYPKEAPRSGFFGHFLLIKKVAAGWPPLASTLVMVKKAKAGAPLNLG